MVHSFLRPPNVDPTPNVKNIVQEQRLINLTSSSTNDPGLPGSNSVSFAETTLYRKWNC